ncbi:MAG TPA: acylphosphatase [Chitinivibrionales bacterium]|nr:acylphosphatase [Chitinivibrionales bacterium]
MAVKRLTITVTGRVQGVGFRYFVKDAADSLGISGWVRNTDDRAVECEAQAEEKDLEEFIGKLREGPPISRVKEVAVNEIPIDQMTEQEFEITY